MYKVHRQEEDECISHCLKGFPVGIRGKSEPGLLVETVSGRKRMYLHIV